MTETEKVLESARTIVEAWKRTNPQGKPGQEQSRRFNDLLEQLYRSGWDYVLGWENELPDENLPARYLRRRAQVIHELEGELANIASRFRGSQEGSEAQKKAISDYHEVMKELFRVSHMESTIDPDAELPDEHMPQAYMDLIQKLVDEYRATHKP
ncbi:hypothetical protein KYC5002_03905 [Archangium violaceum]|uniref:hypothetical protein n=1 Tax=Archangium violaceum TaxID=83451 RepID=UPI002B2A6517|nr:hypothetical protein KYC5002_03905 [Archangium gephyra]